MSKTKATTKPAKSAAATAAALQGKGAPGTALALPSNTAMNLPAGVSVKRVLTLPTLNLKERGEARSIAFLENPKISKVKGKVVAGKATDPATVAPVADIETGEQFTFLIPAVVLSNLARDYGDPGATDKDGKTVDPTLVQVRGLAFYIRCDGKRTDTQRYKDFTIVELDVPRIETPGAA